MVKRLWQKFNAQSCTMGTVWFVNLQIAGYDITRFVTYLLVRMSNCILNIKLLNNKIEYIIN